MSGGRQCSAGDLVTFVQPGKHIEGRTESRRKLAICAGLPERERVLR
jgi:hypothetical protein